MKRGFSNPSWTSSITCRDTRAQRHCKIIHSCIRAYHKCSQLLSYTVFVSLHSFLPLWLCCRVSSMLADSLAPNSASLRLVALSSDRRLVTSWLADWMAPSMRWANCLLSSIIFRIFAWGVEGNPDKVSCWQVDHFLWGKVSPNKSLLFPFSVCSRSFSVRKPS